MDYQRDKFSPEFKRYIEALEDAALLLGPRLPKGKGFWNPDAIGLGVFPVIPCELPIEEFHRVTKDDADNWVPVRDKQGNLIPVEGKSPARWKEVRWKDDNDEWQTKIIRKSIKWSGDADYNPFGEDFSNACNDARNYGRHLGLAVQTTTSLVVVDFDVKPFTTPIEKAAIEAARSDEQRAELLAPAQARMEAAIESWLETYPALEKTRAEITPSGGYHFWLKVKDSMASWADGLSANGKEVHNVQFALEPDGNHVGEVLCGRICLVAPTENGRGPYALLDDQYATTFVEVDDLAAVGIYPVAKGKRTIERTNADGTTTRVMREPQPIPARPQCPEDYDAPLLLSLLGKRAQDVYNGTLAYRGNDRSSNLAGFIHELNAWVAFLHDQGLPYEDGGLTLEDHIHTAADRIGLDDTARVDRIIKSCDKRLCTLSIPPDSALKRYTLRQGGALPDTFSGLVQTERNPFDLCVTDLRTTLVDVVALNLGKADLAYKLKEVAADFEEPLHVVKDLYKQHQDEDSTNEETASAISELVRLRSEGVDVSDILPLRLTNRLLSIRRTAEYDTPLLVATLVSAASAALPLSSTINLSPVEDFTQGLNVWFLILMESGEMKSPLMRRLITDPYKKALKDYFFNLRRAIAHTLATAATSNEEPDEDLAIPPEARAFIQAKTQRVADYFRFEKFKDPETGEECSASHDQLCEYVEKDLLGLTPDLLLSGGGTKQGLDATFETCAKWAGKGVLYLQDEMKALFLKMARPAATEQDFSQWLLSRYDGMGSSEAKADTTRIRNYDTCRLTVLGGIQPDVYRDTLGDDDASGMTARFNAYEQPQVDQLFPDEFTPQDILEAQALKDDLEALYGFLLSIPELTLTLSTDAFKCFQQFRRDAFATKRAEASNAGKSLANKGAGKVGRIAAVLHIVHHAVAARFDTNAATQIPQVVQLESVERAIKLHDLLFKQTLGVRLSSAENDPAAQVALRCHRAAKGKPDGLTITQLRQTFRGANRPSPAETIAACQQLHDQGLGRLVPVTHNGRSGHRYIHLKDL
jgi:hypothetical protein